MQRPCPHRRVGPAPFPPRRTRCRGRKVLPLHREVRGAAFPAAAHGGQHMTRGRIKIEIEAPGLPHPAGDKGRWFQGISTHKLGISIFRMRSKIVMDWQRTAMAKPGCHAHSLQRTHEVSSARLDRPAGLRPRFWRLVLGLRVPPGDLDGCHRHGARGAGGRDELHRYLAVLRADPRRAAAGPGAGRSAAGFLHPRHQDRQLQRAPPATADFSAASTERSSASTA